MSFPDRLVVFSNREQYDKFLESGLKPKDFTVFCDNERFYAVLDREGIVYQKLEETDIRGFWKQINAWGFGKSAGWTALAKKHGFFSEVNCASVIYAFFSISLALMLKNYHLALFLLENKHPLEVLVFKTPTLGEYPNFYGNAFLNHFLAELARKKNIPVRELKIGPPAFDRFPESKAQLMKKKINAFLRQSVHFVYGFAAGRSRGETVMVYGSLRHLAPTMEEFKSKGVSFILYDDEFHKDLFSFALKNGVRYIIPQNIPAKKRVESREFSGKFMAEILAALDHPASKDHFIYYGYDFKEFIRSYIFSSMGPFAENLSRQAARFEDLLAAYPLQGILVEEDFNSRAFMAAFMRSRGVKIFCNSHAYVSLDFEVIESEKVFSQSTTFVNSEHERLSYGWRGYDLGYVKVTGTPRYDRLLKLKNEPSSSPAKLLFSASSLTTYCPDMLGYIGIDTYSYGRYQELVLKTLLEAVRGLPVELVIKPHYTIDEVSWRYLVSCAPGSGARVVSASEDFFDLLGKSDALLVANWSSTIIEAGICRIPVVYVDLESENAKPVEQYAADGFCVIARDVKQLREQILKISRGESGQKSPAPEKEEYYFGKRDGKNSARVAEFILDELKV